MKVSPLEERSLAHIQTLPIGDCQCGHALAHEQCTCAVQGSRPTHAVAAPTFTLPVVMVHCSAPSFYSVTISRRCPTHVSVRAQLRYC